MQPKYKIYASLLDAYSWYRVSESDNALQELIDRINRVPFSSDAADKGTALNMLIDENLKSPGKYQIEYKGRIYDFSSKVIDEINESVKGSVPQLFTSTIIDTSFGFVDVYGYIDFLQMDKAIDLKGTSSFDIGKYKDGMQRHLYPICLAGDGVFVDEFEFLVTDYKSLYRESYTVNIEASKKVVTEACEELINFLHIKRDLIKDKKVFALD